MSAARSNGLASVLPFLGGLVGFIMGQEYGLLGVFICAGIGGAIGSMLAGCFGATPGSVS